MLIEITRKGKALLQLCEEEGFARIEGLLEAAAFDSVSPGICLTEGCGYTCEVEPDQDEGYCELCGRQTVMSALRLADII